MIINPIWNLIKEFTAYQFLLSSTEKETEEIEGKSEKELAIKLNKFDIMI